MLPNKYIETISGITQGAGYSSFVILLEKTTCLKCSLFPSIHKQSSTLYRAHIIGVKNETIIDSGCTFSNEDPSTLVARLLSAPKYPNPNLADKYNSLFSNPIVEQPLDTIRSGIVKSVEKKISSLDIVQPKPYAIDNLHISCSEISTLCSYSGCKTISNHNCHIGGSLLVAKDSQKRFIELDSLTLNKLLEHFSSHFNDLIAENFPVRTSKTEPKGRVALSMALTKQLSLLLMKHIQIACQKNSAKRKSHQKTTPYASYLSLKLDPTNHIFPNLYPIDSFGMPQQATKIISHGKTQGKPDAPSSFIKSAGLSNSLSTQEGRYVDENSILAPQKHIRNLLLEINSPIEPSWDYRLYKLEPQTNIDPRSGNIEGYALGISRSCNEVIRLPIHLNLDDIFSNPHKGSSEKIIPDFCSPEIIFQV